MSIEQWQPYLSAIAAVFSLASLGMILSLSTSFRQVARDRAEVLDEKNKFLQDQLATSDAWFKRQEELGKAENDQLKEKLQSLLNDSGATLDLLTLGKITDGIGANIQKSIEALVVHMEARDDHSRDPDWHLQLAKGHMVAHDWLKAAVQFDEYVKLNPDDPKVQFSRGVAYANAREGRRTDLAALRSYNESVALLSDDDIALKTKGLSYRGAILKRLERLDEAESDLQLALRWTDQDAMREDIRYNLAGVYAMRGDRDRLLAEVRQLKGSYHEISNIRAHLNTYFANFAEDGEFLRALGMHQP